MAEGGSPLNTGRPPPDPSQGPLTDPNLRDPAQGPRKEPADQASSATDSNDCRQPAGPYSHPVYKQVSLANGLVNKMSKEQIKKKLEELHLDTRGHKDVLKKRLKNYYKDRKLVQAQVRKQRKPIYDYYIVIDFEATCDQYNPDGFRHEIIEFPIVLIDAHTVKVIDEFHSYVRPQLNPKLTAFCTNLTGITQESVDRAETFDSVIKRVDAWMRSHHLGHGKKFALITDGPWDMSRFMFLQCQWSKLNLPKWTKRWVNLRKAFCNFYRLRRAKLLTMLENLGMVFEGHPHSGLDDTRNIARIAMRMISDGAELRLNEELFEHKREQNRVHAVVCTIKKHDLLNSYSEDEEETETTNELRQLTDQVDALSLSKPQLQTTEHCEDEDRENYEDLLSYYALQKA